VAQRGAILQAGLIATIFLSLILHPKGFLQSDVVLDKFLDTVR